MIKVAILGSGTCASRFLQKPTDRFPPGFLVSDGSERLLLECSEGIRFRLEKVGVDYNTIQHVAISHAHADHCALVHFVQSQLCEGLFGGDEFANDKLTIYCPNQIAEEYHMVWDFHFPDWKGIQFHETPELTFHPLSSPEGKSIDLPVGKLTGFSVLHGREHLVDALAYRLETDRGVIAYSGDSSDCPGLRSAARAADLFICEATARPGQEAFAAKSGHLTPYQAGLVSHDCEVKKLVIVHYTGLDTVESMIEDCRRSGFSGDVVVAKDLEVYEL